MNIQKPSTESFLNICTYLYKVTPTLTHPVPLAPLTPSLDALYVHGCVVALAGSLNLSSSSALGCVSRSIQETNSSKRLPQITVGWKVDHGPFKK